MSKCYYNNIDCKETIFTIQGILNCNNINSSNHHLTRYSGFLIQDPFSYKSNFWTIFNCTSKEHTILYLNKGNNCFLKYLNFISNQCNSGSLIWKRNGNYSFINGIFYLNKGILISNDINNLELINCFIDHLSSNFTYGSGNLITNNLQYIFKNSFNLIHFSTYLCNNSFFKYSIKFTNLNLFPFLFLYFLLF